MSVEENEGKRLNYEEQLLHDNPHLPFTHIPNLVQVCRQLSRAKDPVKEPFAKAFSAAPLPRGISNSRHFCFMNAVLQALLFAPSFAQLVVATVKEAESCPNCAALGQWFLQYWQPGFARVVVQPPSLPCFKRSLAPSAHFGTEGLMDGSVQQDAQEYLLRLLHVMSDELITFEKHLREKAAKGGKKKKNEGNDDGGSGGWQVIKGKEKLNVREHAFAEGSSALLASVFGGLTESHLKGKKKNKDHVSVTVQPFFTLEVDYKEMMLQQGNKFAPLDVEKALLCTFREEKIEDAKGDQVLTKTTFLKALPSVLILQLKRFSYNIAPYDGSVSCMKDSARFDVKRTLVIPKALCSDQNLPAEARTYQLLSVIAHLGSEQTSGHYTCYLANNFSNPDHVAAAARPAGPSSPTTISSTAAAPSHVVGASVVVKQSRRGRKKGANQGTGTSTPEPQSALKATPPPAGPAVPRPPVDYEHFTMFCDDHRLMLKTMKSFTQVDTYLVVYQKV